MLSGILKVKKNYQTYKIEKNVTHNQVNIYSLGKQVEEVKGDRDGMLENTQTRLRRWEE